MLFSSWQFIFVFLPVVLGVFLLMPARWLAARKAWLGVASLVFYAYWKVEYVPLLLFSIGFNYTLAEVLLRFRNRPSGRLILTGGIAVNLSLLGYFKYINFLISVVGIVVREDFGRFGLILPLAISFFTFTQIAYLVDVYRDHTRHYRLLDYALFVVFFPHLIAGPIVRHWEIIPQYAARQLSPSAVDLGSGALLFLIGLYKKLLLADPVSRYAIAVYGAAETGAAISWFDSWLGTLAFAMQIYFDFSGYSDMAIGLGRMFGFRFPENFRWPYVADTVQDFWRRWHISLSSWFRDYLYVPLGGNRVSPGRMYCNLVLVFFLCGLWHGASWNFVVWGLYHGSFLVAERLGLAAMVRRLPAPLRHAYLLVVVMVGWVFFRADTLRDAVVYLGAMAGVSARGVKPFDVAWFLTPEVSLALIAGIIGSAPIVPALVRVFNRRALSEAEGPASEGDGPGWLPGAAATAALLLVLVASILQIAGRSYDPFIYFRF
jgi:alginate O-acetyltransferase complex protein AlgI